MQRYAIRVAKLRGGHKAGFKPYRAVRLYHGILSARVGSTRARGRHAHACAMRSGRYGARASELLYASIRRETATSSSPRRVHFQDATICSQVVRLPHFEVR
jgi:hypothetical protein